MIKIVKFTTRMPEELNRKAKLIAKSKGYPLNALIVQMLWNLIEKEER